MPPLSEHWWQQPILPYKSEVFGVSTGMKLWHPEISSLDIVRGRAEWSKYERSNTHPEHHNFQISRNAHLWLFDLSYLGHLALPLTISRLDISWCHNFMSVEAPKYFTLFYREILTFAVNARQVETFKPDFCTSRLSWRSAKVLVGKSCP